MWKNNPYSVAKIRQEHDNIPTFKKKILPRLA
jgi:hypothetical protein